MFKTFKEKEFEFETQLAALKANLNNANTGHVKVFEMFDALKNKMKNANVGHVKVFAMFKSLQKERDALRALLKENGIEYETHATLTLPSLAHVEARKSCTGRGSFLAMVQHRPSVEPRARSSLQNYQRIKRETPQLEVEELKQKLDDANAGHVKVFAKFNALVSDRNALQVTLKEKETEYEAQIKALLGPKDSVQAQLVAQIKSLQNDRDTLRATLKEKETKPETTLESIWSG
jgi:FtsZ-binding cell division protein ZapB